MQTTKLIDKLIHIGMGAMALSFLASFIFTPLLLVNIFRLESSLIPLTLSVGLFLSFACLIIVSRNAKVGGILTTLLHVLSFVMGFHLFLTMLTLLVAFLGLFNLSISYSGEIILFTSLLITIYATWKGAIFKVTTHNFKINNLENDVTIMHISDAHIGHHRGKSYVDEIVGRTNKLNPDIVLLNGDLIENNSILYDDTLNGLADLNAKVYFTVGNHESYVDYDLALKRIRDLGITILHNEKIDTCGIQLIGLDYMPGDNDTYDMYAQTDTTVKDELDNIHVDSAIPAVLMHHNPVGLEHAASKGISLTLSGHTHNGQVFPLNYLSLIYFPYMKGVYTVDDMKAFVSQGTGTVGFPLRLGSSNEINFIKLSSN